VVLQLLCEFCFVFFGGNCRRLNPKPTHYRQWNGAPPPRNPVYQRYAYSHRREETKRGHIGCLMSHQKLLEKAVKEGVEQLVIFEDDIKFM
jgi:GR25 family glycosyltransferase involved in LPS biosynthesis